MFYSLAALSPPPLCFPAVKPKSPQVWNVTFHQEPYQAVIHVQNSYWKDYLTIEKQLFQLQIWNATHSMVAQSDRCRCIWNMVLQRVFTGFLTMFDRRSKTFRR